MKPSTFASLLILCALAVAQAQDAAARAETIVIHYRNSSGWSAPRMHWGYEYYKNVSDLSSSGQDEYGPRFEIDWSSAAGFLTACFLDGAKTWDGTDRRVARPEKFPAEVWIKNGDATVYAYNPVDTVPPIAELTAPASGSKLQGKVSVSASASDNQGVARVEFYCDQKLIGSDDAAPYAIEWDTAFAANGAHSLHALAFDLAGNKGQSRTVEASTSNPNLPPVADAGKQVYGIAGRPTYFDASGSKDPNGTIVSYSWTDGQGGTMTGVRPTHVYDTPGTYSATLTVADNEGATDSDTALVCITPAPQARDFRGETIYFLMTARFYDGDPANNYRSPDANNPNSPDDPEWRGDFQGLIEKLDYLKALGFTAVWITPVIENKSGYDFHGYHGYDFFKVDPRLTSAGYDLPRLIHEVHARGMKVVVDIVFNHSGNWGARGLFEPVNNPALPPQQQYMDRVRQLFASRYYHEGWLSSWESYDEQNKSIAGDCMDFDTEDEAARRYLVDYCLWLIELGVDAFRIDTVKHISRYIFNRYLLPPLQEKGGDHFFMFGEVCTRVRSVWNREIPSLSAPFYTWQESKDYSHLEDHEAAYQHWLDNRSDPGSQPRSGNHYLKGNAYRTPDHSRKSHLGVIDFPMHWNFENANTAFGIRWGDDCYNDATWNVTYVDSHDYGPDNGGRRYDGGSGAWAENLSLMFTFRGIPCVYYGTEIEFMAGAPCDQGMTAPLSSTGRAYFGDHIEGTVEVEDFGVYRKAAGPVAQTLERPLARHIMRLNRIRRAIPALQMGQYSTDGASGGLAFKRRYTAGSTDSFALVTISSGATFRDIPNGTYVDAVTGQTRTVSDGTLSIDCAGQGNMRVYVLNLPGNPAPDKIGEDGPFLR